MYPGYFIAYLFGFPMFYPTSPPYPSLLGLLEYDHSIRGSLSLVWLQKKGIWLRVIFKTTNVTIVSDCGNPNHGLWICYSCASKFSEAFWTPGLEWPEHNVYFKSNSETITVLWSLQPVCKHHSTRFPETALGLWVWNSALKWSSWAPESKPRQDHGDGKTSTKDKMWTTIPFGITPDLFLSLYLNPAPHLFWCVLVPWLFKIRTRKQPQILLGLATASKVSDNGSLPEAGLKPLVIYLLAAPLASKSAFYIACVWFSQS